MTKMVVKGGTVYDPLNGIDGEVMDIFIKDGKIVECMSESELRDAKVLDVTGKVVMPGGVDSHTHVAGCKVNTGRVMCPENQYKSPMGKTHNTHSGSGDIVPSTYAQGYTYASMGYTTLFEAAVPPMAARHSHEEFKSLPIVDKAGYLLLGSNWFVMKYLKEGNIDKAAAYIAWALETTKTYGIKLVNPAGVENWKWGKNVHSLDDRALHFDVSAREMIENLAIINERFGLPMSIHLHANNLGHPGNWEITLDTMDVTKKIKPVVNKAGYDTGVKTKYSHDREQSVYMTHIQFHSFGGTSWKDFESKADVIAKHINKSDHIVMDSGSVAFGKAICMTGDGPGLYDIATMTGGKWANEDVELECGSGVTPFLYDHKNKVHSIQWAMGLELMLLTDPKKAIMTTDNPNAGPFMKYPVLIRWLMSRKAREDMMKECHKGASERTTLANIDKELSLYELATVTRATPAKAVGIGYRKGHLSPGADADITVYDISPDYNSNDYMAIEKAFKTAKYTIKDGEVITKEGRIIETPKGRTYYADVKVNNELQNEVIGDIKEWFRKYYSISFSNYPVPEKYLTNPTPLNINAR